MTIQTLDAALAGMQPPVGFYKAAPGNSLAGVPTSYWAAAGFPGPGSFNTTLNGGVYSSSSAQVPGQLPHTDPVSASSYLGRLHCASTFAGTVLLCDRLWDNGGISVTTTTLQAIASPVWPARDANGQTSGVGVFVGLEVSSATSTGTPIVTLTYTNSAGATGQTATLIDATASGEPAGRFHRFALATGDIGVKQVTGVQLSSTWNAGLISLVAYRVLAATEVLAADLGNAVDCLSAGFPRLFNGVVPFLLFVPNGSAQSPNLYGTYLETQG